MKLIRSAKIVILDANGRALLLRRSSTHPTDALMPDIPGGTTEDGETIEEGLVREVQEETGLRLAISELTLLHSLTFDTIPGISINRLLYVAKLARPAPEITISWEHSEYSWVPVADLAGLERPYQKGIDYATKHNLWSAA